MFGGTWSLLYDFTDMVHLTEAVISLCGSRVTRERDFEMLYI